MKALDRRWVVVCLAVATLVLASDPALSQQSQQEVGALVAGPAGLQWRVLVPNEGVTLRVADPFGEVEEFTLEPRETPTFALTDRHGNPRPDGLYTWELRARPVLSPGVRRDLEQARETGDETVEPRLRRMGLLPLQPLAQSGHFRVLNGRLVTDHGLGEPGAGPQADTGLTATASPDGLVARAADSVITDDQIVTGSLCVGFDCLTDGTESFGFDTVRMMENNIQIHFDDTSSTAGFPLNDWRIVANDSSSGGGEYFAVEDATNSKTPFKIEANARTNALYVNSTGRVGIGTATPVLNLHVLSGDTPSIRLDQDTSSGWTAQVWDVAGNESNFFIRDTTGGSKLSFRIQPGAPTNTLTLKSDGKVGIGTWSPTEMLTVVNAAGNASLLFDSSASANLMLDRGNTASFSRFQFLSAGTMRWSMGMINDASNNFHLGPNISTTYLFVNQSNGRIGIGTKLPAHPLEMGSGAYVTEEGVWTDASSRSYKQDIEELGADDAAETLAALEPVTFAYKANPDETYVGFIAEDVPELVASGGRKGLSPMDIVAVLTKVVQEQQKTIADQQATLSAQQAALAGLQARVAQLESR